jgi:hypothetical protein
MTVNKIILNCSSVKYDGRYQPWQSTLNIKGSTSLINYMCQSWLHVKWQNVHVVIRICQVTVARHTSLFVKCTTYTCVVCTGTVYTIKVQLKFFISKTKQIASTYAAGVINKHRERSDSEILLRFESGSKWLQTRVMSKTRRLAKKTIFVSFYEVLLENQRRKISLKWNGTTSELER